MLLVLRTGPVGCGATAATAAVVASFVDIWWPMLKSVPTFEDNHRSTPKERITITVITITAIIITFIIITIITTIKIRVDT